MVSKQLSLLRGRVGDTTDVVDSLGFPMRQMVQDAVASCRGDVVGHFGLIMDEFQKVIKLKFEFFSINTFNVL